MTLMNQSPARTDADPAVAVRPLGRRELSEIVGGKVESADPGPASTAGNDFVLQPLPKRSLAVLNRAPESGESEECPYPLPAGGGGPHSDLCGCAQPMTDMCNC